MKRLLCVAALATAYKLTPKELVYAEMRRQVGEFPAANHSNEATIYVRDMLSPCTLYLPRTVNGTGHTGPSEFCATSI